MSSTGDGTGNTGANDVSPEREAASLIAMLWFIGDRMRELGYEQSAKVIEDARAAFEDEISKAD